MTIGEEVEVAPAVERQLAEHAFAALDSDGAASPRQWPAAADRIREARKLKGLTDVQVAERVGMSTDSYYDLEARKEEVFTVPSLAEIVGISQVLSLPLRALLLGETGPEKQEITFAEISHRLRQQLTASGLSVDAFGEKIGWDVRDALSSPDSLWDFNLVALRDVCRAVGVDWVTALPDQDSSPPRPFQRLSS